MPFLGTFPAYGGGPPPLASSVLESPAPARSVAGLPLSFPETTGVPRPMPGGVVARPAA